MNKIYLVGILALIGVILIGMRTPGSFVFNQGGTVNVYRGDNVFLRACGEGSGITRCDFFSHDYDSSDLTYIYVDDALVAILQPYRQQPSYSASFSVQNKFEITIGSPKSVEPTVRCGDSICSVTESANTCPSDCTGPVPINVTPEPEPRPCIGCYEPQPTNIIGLLWQWLVNGVNSILSFMHIGGSIA